VCERRVLEYFTRTIVCTQTAQMQMHLLNAFGFRPKPKCIWVRPNAFGFEMHLERNIHIAEQTKEPTILNNMMNPTRDCCYAWPMRLR